jgi:hypothetical protein
MLSERVPPLTVSMLPLVERVTTEALSVGALFGVLLVGLEESFDPPQPAKVSNNRLDKQTRTRERARRAVMKFSVFLRLREQRRHSRGVARRVGVDEIT